MAEVPLELSDVFRSFQQGVDRLEVLKGINLRLRPGEIVALTGPSGAGKSTLLQIAGLLEPPDSGEIRIGGRDCIQMADTDRTLVRRTDIGFVYQFHHLLAEFTALENVMVPQLIAERARHEASEHAEELLNLVGLGERLGHRPAELSGGEQQRVAIARALANQPMLLLADEPTGNLDQKTSDSVFDELLELVRERKLTALVATHNATLAARMDREVTIIDGKLASG